MAKTQQQVQPNKEHAMQIDVRINSISMEGSVRASASVNLNNCLAIRNVRLVEGEKGLFLSMPSYKNGNGEYKDICFPITAEFRNQLRDAVTDAYKQSLMLQQGKMKELGDVKPPQMAPEGQAM